MDEAEAPSERSGIWICPACGARLVSRNLWHSCGRYSLENLFAKADPGSLELARTFVAVLRTLGDVQVLPQKTRLVCVARGSVPVGWNLASTGSWPTSPSIVGWTARAS